MIRCALNRLVPPPLRRWQSLRRRVLALEAEVADLRAQLRAAAFDPVTREAIENLVVSAPIAFRTLRRSAASDSDGKTA